MTYLLLCIIIYELICALHWKTLARLEHKRADSLYADLQRLQGECVKAGKETGFPFNGVTWPMRMASELRRARNLQWRPLNLQMFSYISPEAQQQMIDGPQCYYWDCCIAVADLLPHKRFEPDGVTPRAR